MVRGGAFTKGERKAESKAARKAEAAVAETTAPAGRMPEGPDAGGHEDKWGDQFQYKVSFRLTKENDERLRYATFKHRVSKQAMFNGMVEACLSDPDFDFSVADKYQNPNRAAI